MHRAHAIGHAAVTSPSGKAAHVAVVTGHSRGLGAGIAEHLLDRGIAVLGIARHENPALVKRFGNLLNQVTLNLSDAGALSRWLAGDDLTRFLHSSGTAILVNNAGQLQPLGPLDAQDVAAVGRAVAVNVAAPLMLSAAFAFATSRASDRRILHISSRAGHVAYAGWSIYCATKAALDHHARTVVADRTRALRICSLAPGVIDTDMQSEIRNSTDALTPERPRFVALHREGKLPSARDKARAVVDYLLSDAFGSATVIDLADVTS